MSIPIDEFSRRPQRYWYVDGLAEMAGGSIILLIGLLYLALPLLPGGPAKDWLGMLGLPLLVIAGAVVSRKAVAHFKERLTYPRTGYVAYKQPKGSRRLLVIFSTVVLAASMAILVSLAQSFLSINWLPIVASSMIALFTLYLAYRFSLRRFYALAAVAFLLGLVTARLALPTTFDSGFYFSALGLAWILSGALTLVSYLRSTRPATEEEA